MIGNKSGNASTVNTVNVIALSVNTSAANHLVAGIFGLNKNKTFTPPAGKTEEWDALTLANAMEVADYVQAGTGATPKPSALAAP